MAKRRRSSGRRSVRRLERLARLCYVAAAIIAVLILASFLTGGGGGNKAASTSTTTTTARPRPTVSVPTESQADQALTDVLGATPKPNEAAVVDSGSFGGIFVLAPDFLQARPQGDTPINSIAVRDDAAAQAGTDLGVLVYTPEASFDISDPGTAHVYYDKAVRDDRGIIWLPITGTVDELNHALASLVYHARGDVGPQIMVVAADDLGPNGQVRKARRAIPMHRLL